MGWIKKSKPTDTGWRDVSADLRLGTTGVLHIRRVGLHVHWRVRDLVAGEGHAFYWPPAGLAAPSSPIAYPPQSAGNTQLFYLDSVGRLCRERSAPALATNRWWEGVYLLPPGTAPLTSPPGEEVS